MDDYLTKIDAAEWVMWQDAQIKIFLKLYQINNKIQAKKKTLFPFLMLQLKEAVHVYTVKQV